jgi:hypothetical protein
VHLIRTLRAVGLLSAGVAATLVVWVAASPPATTTLAPTTLTPGAMGRP